MKNKFLIENLFDLAFLIDVLNLYVNSKRYFYEN